MTTPTVTDADLAEMEARLERLGHLTIGDSFSGRAKIEEEKALSYFREHLPALVAAYRQALEALALLWAAYTPEDYLELEDADYGPMALAQRKAWQRAAGIVGGEP